MKTLKVNLTQLVLIILSILIAFGIDRLYESYKTEKRKRLFLIDQIDQLTDANSALTLNIEQAIELKAKAEKGLGFTDNVDSLIHYTEWMGSISFFNPEISSLSELNGIYNINEILDVEVKKDFQRLYQAYENIEFYEKNYSLTIYDSYTPFWRKNFNLFDKTYPDKSVFLSDEYLNIIETCRSIIDRRIDAYLLAKESQENFIQNLKK